LVKIHKLFKRAESMFDDLQILPKLMRIGMIVALIIHWVTCGFAFVGWELKKAGEPNWIDGSRPQLFIRFNVVDCSLASPVPAVTAGGLCVVPEFEDLYLYA